MPPSTRLRSLERGEPLTSSFHYVRRIYARNVRGAKIITMTAAPKSEAKKLHPMVPELASSRMAVTRCEIGLMLTNPCSQLGIVSTGTNALERNVRGNNIIMDIPDTLEAVRAITPKKAKIQLTAQAQTMTSTPAIAT